MSPPADRQSSTGSAVYETASRKADESPALAALRDALDSDGDIATKTYDLDELNRLKAMSNRSSAVLAAQEQSDSGDDTEELTTGQLNITDAPLALRKAVGAPTPEEDDPFDDGPTRARVIEDPRQRRAPAPRPLAGMRPMPPGVGASVPEINVPPPIDDEESNDEGPTIRKHANLGARAVLAAGRTDVTTEPPPMNGGDEEDDPLDDGPTRMRPQESFPLPAGRIPPPPPAAEPDRNSQTAILESLRAEIQDPNRKPMETAPWDEEAPDPLIGATTRLPALELAPSPYSPIAQGKLNPAGLMTSPFPAATVPLQNSGPATSSWPLKPAAGGAPMVAPPMGPPVAPPMGPPVAPSIGPPTDLGQGASQPPQAGGNRQRFIAALVGVMLGLAVLLVYGAFSESDPSDTPATSATASVAPPPPKVSAPPQVSAAPPPMMNVAEEEARAALTKLRDGLSGCVQKGQGALPETAAAVPASLRMTRPDGYNAKAEDWKATIWACSRFKPAGSMHYQLQWQSSKPFLEGAAVAWIDSNGDGTADRAFAFHVTMKVKGKIELGEVGPMDPSHKVLSP